MKAFIVMFLLLATPTAFSYERAFENLPEEICPNALVYDYGYSVICQGHDNASMIAHAAKKNRVALKKLPDFVLYLGAIELSVLPDADTNNIYFYPSLLKDTKGKIIGYIVIDGYVNTEMEVKLQLESRYNLKGQLVSITLKN
jgi:hypothetical protein